MPTTAPRYRLAAGPDVYGTTTLRTGLTYTAALAVVAGLRPDDHPAEQARLAHRAIGTASGELRARWGRDVELDAYGDLEAPGDLVCVARVDPDRAYGDAYATLDEALWREVSRELYELYDVDAARGELAVAADELRVRADRALVEAAAAALDGVTS